MNWLHAFFALVFLIGAGYAISLLAEFLGLHIRHRRIARNRRWPTSQHPSYFRDYK